MFILNLPAIFPQFLFDHWILLTLLSLLLPLVYWYSTRNFDYWTKRGIKGPPNVPFWGSAFSLRCPVPLLYVEYVKKYSKCFGVFQGQTPELVLADPALIKRILVQDFHHFRNRPRFPPTHRIFAQNIVAARDEEWKRIRSILSSLFTTLKLRKMEGHMRACVDSLMVNFDSKAEEGKPFQAMEPMSNYTMDVIARCAFATETNAHSNNKSSNNNKKDNELLRNAHKITEFRLYHVLMILLLPRWLQQWLTDRQVWPFHREEVDYFEGLTRHLIRERRKPEAKGYSDLLQLMVNAEHNPTDQQNQNLTTDDGHFTNSGTEELEREQRELRTIIGSKHLTEEEIMAQSMVFFLAGYETSSLTLSYALYELALNPGIQERLYREIQQAKLRDPALSCATLNEMPYLDAVISEVLRKYPPPPMLKRVASTRYRIPELNLTLEPGQQISIPVYALHHSEEYFPQPAKFEPDRFLPENRHKLVPYSYLPFGGGPRNCIGMRFALAEARMGLANMLNRFRFVKVEGVTRERLELELSQSLLKTSPIELGVERRC